MPLRPEEEPHSDRERFFNELEEVLATCSARSAFCVGLVATAVMLRETPGFYLPKTAMELAAEQNPRAITGMLERAKKKAREGEPDTHE